MSKRIISVDFFRFFFMLQICLWHLESCVGMMTHGYIAVEFFFILSGYLIYKSSIKDNAKGVFDYTWEKIKRFYPEVLIVTLPAFVVSWAILNKSILPLFNSIFFLQDIGIYGGGVNPSLWYLNVLLLGGGIIYAILNNNRHLAISIILPLIVLLTYTYILSYNNGGLEMWGNKYCFHIPLWRGIAGLSLGCLLARFHEIKLQNPTICKKRILNLLCIMSLIGSIYVAFSKTHNDRYALFFYSIIILCCFTPDTIVNKLLRSSIWNYFGELSFEMLLVHMPIALSLSKINQKIGGGGFFMITLYLSLVLLFSVILRYIYKKLLYIIQKKNDKHP